MIRKLSISFLASSLLAVSAYSEEFYKLPPQEVIDIIDAPPLPRASINPTGDLMLLVEYESLPSIAYMSQPLLRLAGTRITPNSNSRQQTSFVTGLIVKSIDGGSEKRIQLPDQAKMGTARWSIDGQWIAFSVLQETGFELWVANASTGESKRLTGPDLNATLNSGFAWLPENRLLAYTVLKNRGQAPRNSNVPLGPNIQETSGRFATVRTYQDLLQTPHDAELFKYYATSQIQEIDIDTGKSREIGGPDVYSYVNPSPDGELLLVNRIKEPYSFSVPYYAFPQSSEIWDRDGHLVHLFADHPLRDEVPIRGVPTGPRSIRWRPLNPATLVWVEALDGGDPENEAPFRDKLMSQAAPFASPPSEITKIEHRYAGISWLQEEGLALLTERDWKRRWKTVSLINVDDANYPSKKIIDISYQDRYNDPGRTIFTTTDRGEYLVIQDGDSIFLSGSGASPKGDLPFLDRMNLQSGESERLFHCAEGSYEIFIDFVGSSSERIVTRYESKTEPPNYYLRDLKRGTRQALTDFKDPAPQMTGMRKQLLKYHRNDGVELSGTLYLPKDYKEGDRLPCVIWAYPLEYQDNKVAGQVRGSPSRFTQFRGTSQLFYVTQGYAVLDGAQIPVIGDPKTMNDTFIEQNVAGLKAAIDKLDEMGVIDTERIGVGGHSYGAFMTANLLAHCDLVAAGVARSGAYNRTLTPFGFQSERRTLWQAPETYFKVSPFMHAHKINEPILLIHGEADNNSGTFPMQSQRLYHALKGHGATARLVMLPNESHGYRARESVLHTLAEMFEWFDRYVNNKPSEENSL